MRNLGRNLWNLSAIVQHTDGTSSNSGHYSTFVCSGGNGFIKVDDRSTVRVNDVGYIEDNYLLVNHKVDPTYVVEVPAPVVDKEVIQLEDSDEEIQVVDVVAAQQRIVKSINRGKDHCFVNTLLWCLDGCNLRIHAPSLEYDRSIAFILTEVLELLNAERGDVDSLRKSVHNRGADDFSRGQHDVNLFMGMLVNESDGLRMLTEIGSRHICYNCGKVSEQRIGSHFVQLSATARSGCTLEEEHDYV